VAPPRHAPHRWCARAFVGGRRPAGAGVLARPPDLFARICGYFDSAGFSIQDAKIHTTRTGYALDTFQVVSTRFDPDDPSGYRDLISLVETQAAMALASDGPLPEPASGRVSRRVRSFPVTPRVSLAPDERAQRWLLTVSASDRSGLLYAIARVLARHQVNLQLAKVSTLGERVEDTFLVDGPALQQAEGAAAHRERAARRRGIAGLSHGTAP
jgi:[protein-PII] uridylyltransferase